MRTSIKTLLGIAIFMSTSFAWSMEEESGYYLFSTVVNPLLKKIAKESDREGYLLKQETNELLKELDERIKQGNLKNSKADAGLFKLQTRVAERSWTAQTLIANAYKEGNIAKMMNLVRDYHDIIPPLFMRFVDQVRKEELADTQKHEKELNELIPFGEQPKTPMNAKKHSYSSPY